MVRTHCSACARLLPVWIVIAGCSGAIGDGALEPEPGAPAASDSTNVEPGAPAPVPVAPTAPVSGANGTSTPAPPAGAASSPAAGPSAAPAAFTTVRETLRLLPFDARLNRLAVAMGLPSSDKLFDGLRARRLELGDQDYGKGVTPDPSWSPNRMSLWIKLMRPICQSAPMTAKFPSLRTDPAPLIAAAWGRPAEAADLDAVRGGLAAVPDARRGELTCLAVLTAVEFVAR